MAKARRQYVKINGCIAEVLYYSAETHKWPWRIAEFTAPEYHGECIVQGKIGGRWRTFVAKTQREVALAFVEAYSVNGHEGQLEIAAAAQVGGHPPAENTEPDSMKFADEKKEEHAVSRPPEKVPGANTARRRIRTMFAP